MITTVKVDTLSEAEPMHHFEMHKQPSPGSVVSKYNRTTARYDGLGIVAAINEGDALVVWSIYPSVDAYDGMDSAVSNMSKAFDNVMSAVSRMTPTVDAMISSMNSIMGLSGISTEAIKKTLSGLEGGKPKRRKGNKRAKRR